MAMGWVSFGSKMLVELDALGVHEEGERVVKAEHFMGCLVGWLLDIL